MTSRKSLVIVSLLALVLGACGGDDSDAGDTDSTPAPTPSDTTGENESDNGGGGDAPQVHRVGEFHCRRNRVRSHCAEPVASLSAGPTLSRSISNRSRRVREPS